MLGVAKLVFMIECSPVRWSLLTSGTPSPDCRRQSDGSRGCSRAISHRARPSSLAKRPFCRQIL
jgi:hypothetical protein